MPTVSVNLDVTQYVQVNSGLNPLLLQCHRDSVRVVISEVKPARSNKVFHLLGADDTPLHFHSIDTNVWVLAVTDRASLIVSETTDVPVSVNNVVDVSETDLTHETDVVGQLCEISRKLSLLIEYHKLITDVDLGE